MKRIFLFYHKNGKFCVDALRYLQELQKEPKFMNLKVILYDEEKERELQEKYCYFFTPAIFVDDQCVHEGKITKKKLQSILEDCL